MPIWADLFRLFQYAAENDPLSALKDPKNFTSAGIASPEALGSDFSAAGPTGQSSYRQTYDMIDTTTLSNRSMRYKEYERLRNVPEIESAMTVFSDEACVSGDTKIATPFGFVTIKNLAEKNADDRFLVYCYDFSKNDFTLGWAYAPRLVKKSKTRTIIFDNGCRFTATLDHRVLKRDGKWVETGELKFGDELMAFYRIPAPNKLKHRQHPRIFSHNRGWINEYQFLEDWKLGKTGPEFEKCNRIMRMVGGKLNTVQISKSFKIDRCTINDWLATQGFTYKEAKRLYTKPDRRRVIGIINNDEEEDVYDLSVDTHKCFATDGIIAHNCQKDEEGNVVKIVTNNDEVKEELQYLFLNRRRLNINRNAWTWFKNLCIFGDQFLEVVIDPDDPKEGVCKLISLPPETMYRIETVKGKLIEFQQSKEGPDYQAIQRGATGNQNDMEMNQSTAIRFAPTQIIHFRIGDDRKTFYPYGQSLIEPARGPAHSLRLLEDAMVTYRLVRAPERRVFYIDVGQLPPFKAEAFLDRLKDQFRKRKITSNRNAPGANSVEERWMPPAQDEDYWLPIRPNSNTRIETLPGAENLGEIDDAIYFRNKLLTSLNFPKNYFNNEDPGATRITLSAQDVKFARMIERLQSHFEDGLLEIAERHLQLRGFPEESFMDLKVKMTAPSDWRELSRTEVVSARYGNASQLKSSNIMSDYDILTKIMKYSEDETEEIIARLKLQKLEDLKLQVLAQNPQLIGVGIPGQEDEQEKELGSEAGGPTNMPSPDEQQPQAQEPSEGSEQPEEQQKSEKPTKEGMPLPEPSDEDIKKYGLEIQGYDSDQDYEDIDYSVQD